jgi:hypothetical protein
MIPAHSYEGVCEDLRKAFQDRYMRSNRPIFEHFLSGKADGEQLVRLVGLLFARPQSKLAADEIVPHLDYFHHRSGLHVDFFCGGYGGYWEGSIREIPDQQVVGPGRYANWLFSALKFDAFRMEIERRTAWRYSGGVDLILTNAIYDVNKGRADLDFSSAIEINLDRAKADGAIQSVEMFVEQICQYAEHQSGSDPTWGFSDRMGVGFARSALKGFVLALLPKGVESDGRRAFHLTVQDIGR